MCCEVGARPLERGANVPVLQGPPVHTTAEFASATLQRLPCYLQCDGRNGFPPDQTAVAEVVWGHIADALQCRISHFVSGYGSSAQRRQKHGLLFEHAPAKS